MGLLWKTFTRHYMWKTLFFACLLLLVGSFYTDNYAFLKEGKFGLFGDNISGATVFTGDTVKLDFYVMSQCPYGVQVETGVDPVLRKLGNAVDYNVHFIGSANGGAFQSLHGQPEVDEDMRQVCIMKHSPDKYVDYLACVNKNIAAVASNWEGCAKGSGVDVEAVNACFAGQEGKDLLAASFKASDDAGASGSPTIFVNGKPYQSGRDALSFQRALCQGLDSHPECLAMPECGSDADCAAQEGKESSCGDGKCVYEDAVKVEMTVVTHKGCADCDPSQIVDTTKRYFPGIVVKEVEATSDEGKALVEKYQLRLAPAYLFGQSLEDTRMWKAEPRLQGSFEATSDGYKLLDEATGASFWLDEKARAAQVASMGITLGDNKPQLDFFTMSYCPYGNMADEAIEPVYQLLKDKAVFNPRYVIYSNYQGGGAQYCMDAESKLCSMHGVQEMHQDIRELCVANKLGVAKFFEFVLKMNKECTAQNADTCWKGVADALKMDTAMVEKCLADEGKSLGDNELKLSALFGAQGSPAVYIDGVEYSGPRTPEGYKTALCAAFDTAPEECKTKLAGEAAASGTQAPAAGCVA
ncbi:MAG: hypothetical protein AABY09_05630 [Nanoarchaeota archaeon]